MKKFIYFNLLVLFIFACNAQDKKPIKGATLFQKEMNNTFKDASTSPLSKRDLKKFNGLDFFKVDSNFVVKATLKKSADAPIFKFPTTTNRIAEYAKYGTLVFKINGKEFSLAVYKSTNTYGNPAKYRNHLFLPFLDKTNGKTSYEGGRFIDLLTTDVKEDGTILIDFNKAYNPYCAYSKRYSCPITPRDNFLAIEINAGVMAYKKP